MGNCLNITKDDKLENNLKSARVFSLKGRYRAKVIDVYDGDTITVVFLYKGDYVKTNIRLLGYDAPEMKPSKNLDNRHQLISQAINVKEHLSSYVLNKFVDLEITSNDKYGNRWLGNVSLNKLNINQEMLKNPYCKPYNGGKK